ncbi:MAG TPA: protocatechuate 3,4-dioxygenase subunit alpha [Conexibacter sp.]|nr:protocatechuate 3,4-dioxygenase subunit alpha [Conexibacter sp.]
MKVEPTPSQTVGPYFALMLRDELLTMGPPGLPGALLLAGTVLDGAARPVTDAMLELWQADAAGRYVVDDPAAATPPGFTGFARVPTDTWGRYRVEIVKPGRVGAAAPHIAVSVFARGLLQRLVTRVYFPDEQAANAADPVLAGVDPARRGTLVASAQEGGALHYDVRLQGPGETAFFGVAR